DVLAMLVRQGFHPVWIGGAIGVAASIIAAPLLSRWLFGVGPIDRVTIAAALGTVGLVAMFASYLPARRASRTDPATVFRCDCSGRTPLVAPASSRGQTMRMHLS